MKRWLLIITFALCSTLAVPSVSTAQKMSAEETELQEMDARFFGYPQTVYIKGGTATSYFLLVLLGLVGFGGLFKSSRRTHLD